MIHLLGESWQKPAMESALVGLEIPDRVLPIGDFYLEAEGSCWRALPEGLRRLATDRAFLRRFCRDAGLPVPQWRLGGNFDEVSREAMALGKFPLALKSNANGSGGAGVFRLEGYRELPSFHEKIKALSPDARVLIEDWIEPTATVEITIVNGGSTLMVQKGLQKALTAKTAWEIFPIKLPERYGREVEKIMDAFSALLSQKGILVRFTIAFTGKTGYLISLSGAFNRLEYFPGWSDNLGSPSILKSMLEEVPMVLAPVKAGLARLQFLRRPARQNSFPEKLPGSAQNLPVKNYFSAGRKALALLEGKEPRVLQEQVTQLMRLLEEETVDRD